MEDESKRPSTGTEPAGHRRLNAGKLTGQKPALKMKEVWSIRTRLELEGDVRNLVLFNLAIDSNLRGCDLVRLKVGDFGLGPETGHSSLAIAYSIAAVGLRRSIVAEQLRQNRQRQF